MEPRSLLINGKWPLTLPYSSAIEWESNMARHGGTWEGMRLDRLRSILASGDNVLYVGAYKGDMPALLASWGVNVGLVEASAGLWGLIKEAWEVNNFSTPKLMFSGLASSRTCGSVPKAYNYWPERVDSFVEGTTGFMHLDESQGREPEVSVDFMVGRSGFIPKLISIDVEGSEWEVLKGAENTLKEYQPALMLSVHPEFMFTRWNQYEHDMHVWLKKLGYVGEHVDYNHEHHWLYTGSLK